jgi:hypothetical protein
MRQFIVFVSLIAAVGIGGYLYLFKKNDVKALFDSPAKTPKDAVDKFRAAIQARDYEKAARYCTSRYAEILTKSHSAARELGLKIDDVYSRFKDDGLLTDEHKVILFGFDPFPKDILLIVGSESEREAVINISADLPRLAGQNRPYETWKIDTSLWGALYKGLPPTINAIKEGEGEKAEWKLDFPTPSMLQTSATRLNDKYKDYVNPLKVLSREVKNEPTTKENVTRRLKELLEEAARN